MKKGFVNLLELSVIAIVLVLAFAHFFPQYKIKTEWDDKLVEIELRDTLITIDRLNKTYVFATGQEDFGNFMNRIYSPDRTGKVYVWWNKTDGLGSSQNPTPYYTQGTEKTIVDVVNDTGTFRVYAYSVGLGTPF